ncbi:glycosyltransferase [Parvibaculum sp.]|uniref:glycosyltransferase n=1 Tax=Parvibaculum sp. TaxID=2024848 RepID=UPI00329769B8
MHWGQKIRDFLEAGGGGSFLPKPLAHRGEWRADLAAIGGSPIFDPQWYLEQYPDVAASKLDPLEHFCRYGAAEERDPGPLFSVASYCKGQPELLRSGENALVHYLKSGGRKRAVFNRFFHTGWYLRKYPRVKKSGCSPLEHYIENAASGNFDPGPQFSTSAYLDAYPSLRRSGENPLAHFMTVGATEDVPACPDVTDTDAAARERARTAHEAFFRRFGFPRLPVEIGDRAALERAAEYVAALTPVMTIDAEEPDVSIVIPVFGQIHFVLSLLESLAWHRTGSRVEIVVVDDCSPAAACAGLLERIPWIRLVRNSVNLGFLRSCNRAVELGRGKYTVLLNSDTRVITRWLDELVATFTSFPRAGLVGSKLLNGDLSLQDGGAIVFNDGRIRLCGRGGDPDNPFWSYARQADYVSGASLAIRRDVWNELRGFDETFAPAYCEDADLAFRAREAGYEVWYQPVSQVIHHEGVTHGTATDKGVKANQVVNLGKFRERWQHVLDGHGSRGPDSYTEANRYTAAPLVVLDHRIPTPDRDAGSVLADSLIRAYIELGWHVIFAPTKSRRPSAGYARNFRRLGVECLVRPHFRTFTDVTGHLARVGWIDYILAFRVNVLTPVMEELRTRWPGARIIYNTVDLHHLRESRQAELTNDDEMRGVAAQTKQMEMRLVADADCTVFLAPTEFEMVVREEPAARDTALVFPYVFRVPENAKKGLSPARRHIVFLGGFCHLPNIDAAVYLKERIWPRLRERLPADAKLMLVGADAGPDILALDDDRFEVKGFVPDLAPVFDAARVFVAPLRYGAGIKGKLVHALAYGVPSVATSVAVEGMGLADGRDVLVADGEEAFCDAVLRLYEDEALWQELQRNGVSFVERNYSWESCLERCQTMLDIADRSWARRHAAAERLVV